jgi:hypothetical protein
MHDIQILLRDIVIVIFSICVCVSKFENIVFPLGEFRPTFLQLQRVTRVCEPGEEKMPELISSVISF